MYISLDFVILGFAGLGPLTANSATGRVSILPRADNLIEDGREPGRHGPGRIRPERFPSRDRCEPTRQCQQAPEGFADLLNDRVQRTTVTEGNDFPCVRVLHDSDYAALLVKNCKQRSGRQDVWKNLGSRVMRLDRTD